MVKKLLSVLLSAGVALLSFSGGFVNAATAETSSPTLTGQVTAISGSSITLALGTENKPENSGTPPTGTSETTSTDSSSDTSAVTSTPPTADSSTTVASSGTAPTGAPSDSTGGGGKQGGLTLTGETQTITISDSTVITIDEMGQQTTGALSDITVGSILTVTMSGTTVTAVSVRQGGTAQGGGNQGTTATPTTSAVTVNGTTVSFQAYNIGGSNYFKLRDIAKALDGTDKQFEVGYDSTTSTITITSGSSYTSVGGELTTSTSTSSVSSTASTITIYLDDTKLSITPYNISGSNYFKLRDLASALDFAVTYNSTTGVIAIDTTTGYTN